MNLTRLAAAKDLLPKNAPVPTFLKKGLARAEARKAGNLVRSRVIPGIDANAITRRYGSASALQADYAVFRVPLTASADQYEHIRNEAVRKWLDVKLKDKWDCVLPKGIKVEPGVYPARDLVSGEDLWDHREYIIGAWFVPQVPRLVRIELDPELVAPTTIGR